MIYKFSDDQNTILECKKINFIERLDKHLISVSFTKNGIIDYTVLCYENENDLLTDIVNTQEEKIQIVKE